MGMSAVEILGGISAYVETIPSCSRLIRLSCPVRAWYFQGTLLDQQVSEHRTYVLLDGQS